MSEYIKDDNPKQFEPHYSKHVAAMTAEGLDSKSDIALELARRDAEIERLRSPWQDIATAPREKTEALIDLWCYGRRFMDCYWDHICKEYRTTGSAGVMQRLEKPTHWMPVPPVPAPPQEGV